MAELHPSRCGSPPSPEERSRLLPLARDPTPTTRSLAAAVRLSTDVGALTRTLRRLEIRPANWTLAEHELALGALEHALAKASGNAAYLVSAFDHTETSLAESPSSLPGLFNRALIASDLGLCRVAEQTWGQYLEMDRTSDWGREAGERLALLPCAGTGVAQESSADDLFKSSMEPLLGNWIDARLAGSRKAETLLEKIRQAGEELHARTGEPMIRELAHDLAAASAPRHLAAIESHVRVRALFEEETPSGDEELQELRTATQPLRELSGWLAAWNDVWLAGLDIDGNDFAEAERRLMPLARSPELARSPHLQGRVFWALGLSAMRAGRLQTAYDRILRAEKEFRKGSYWTSAASVWTLRAETLAHLGFWREAWEPRILALRAMQAVRGRFSFSHNSLLDGASFAQRTSSYALADAFLEEAAQLARTQGNMNSEIEALLAKARALRQRGSHAKASAEFHRALDSIRSLEMGRVRERFEKIATFGLWTDPARTGRERAAELRAAAAFFAANGLYFLQLQALRVQAAQERREGAFAAARNTLDSAVRVIRRLQADIHADEAGIRQLDSVQDLFDEAIEAAVAENQPLRALDLLEAARRGEVPEPGALRASRGLDLEPRMSPASPDGEPLVVVLGMTPEIFVWWQVDGRAVRWGWSAVAPVEKAVRAILDSSPSGRTTPGQLEHLYEVLLADALRGVPPGRPLILVPDGPLQRVPFSALRNRETGVRLIEERAVSLRSSLRAAREQTGRRPSLRSQWRVIAVGDPAFDAKRLPLARLPGAAREAEEVAAVYGQRARLLLGEEASVAAVSRAAAAGEVLHLAAHATLGEDAFKNALVLAASPDGETSGLATAEEILPAAGSLRLVVLSGCSTLGIEPSRAGGLLGLARGFAARGVPVTLGTLWPLDDRLLPALMADFHRFLLQGRSASEALRQAQLAYLAKNPGSCCGWAGLQLIGDVPAEPPAHF